MLDLNPGAARDRDTVNVIVGECFDGWLSDARALAVRPSTRSRRSPPQRRTSCGGRGRRGHRHHLLRVQVGRRNVLASVDGHVLGCLVVSNYGASRDLHLLVGEGAELPDAGPEPPAQGGSIMIVVGTDAPLSERQLRRLAVRGAFGLGRAGSFASNASGEYVLSFSTAHRPHRVERDRDELSFLRDDSEAVRNLFEAAGDVVQESVLNSLCSRTRWRAATATAPRHSRTSCWSDRAAGSSTREAAKGPRRDPSPDPRTAHPCAATTRALLMRWTR